MNPPAVETIELLSGASSPRPLFVLLHDAGGTALDMLDLGNRLGDAFAEAAVLIPGGLNWPADASGSTDALALGVRTLADFLRLQQQRFNVLQSDTALLGFGAGARLALALSDAHDGWWAGCWPLAAATPLGPRKRQGSLPCISCTVRTTRWCRWRVSAMTSRT